MGLPARKFRTRNEAFRLSIKTWVCKSCHQRHELKKPERCIQCKHTELYKFDSKIEANRFFELFLLQQAKHIRNLETQVNIPLKVNGMLICTYRADFIYVMSSTNKKIIEDIKPKSKNDKAITRHFKIVQKLMGAIHGYEISIERR